MYEINGSATLIKFEFTGICITFSISKVAAEVATGNKNSEGGVSTQWINVYGVSALLQALC